MSYSKMRDGKGKENRSKVQLINSLTVSYQFLTFLSKFLIQVWNSTRDLREN